MTRRARSAFSAVFLVGLVFAVAAAGAAAATPMSFFRSGVPDFEQRNAMFPNGGNNHCAPTAAANSFTWFDNNGFDIVPDMWKDTPTMPNNHNGLIGQLAMSSMTSGASGTWRDDYVKGLRQYLRSANNQSGHQFDVKFQGSGYRGYTVGSQGATATLDFLKQEISSGEDVMLHIGWFQETAPGTLGARMGGHVVTLDGYTSDNKLLIRDPFFPEGIIEPDSSFMAADMIFEYTTAASPATRAKIEAITSVSPKPILFDGLIIPSEYQFASIPHANPDLQAVSLSTFSDYVSFGLDHVGLAEQPILPDNPARVTIVNQDTQQGFQLTYDSESGLTDVQEGQLLLNAFVPLGPFDNSSLFFQVATAVGTSMNEQVVPHPQTEFHIDREVFGNLAADSLFNVLVQLADANDGFQFELSPQSLTDLLSSDAATDHDPVFQYPSEDPFGDDTAARNAAIAQIPEPSLFAMLCWGLPCLLFGRARRRYGCRLETVVC